MLKMSTEHEAASLHAVAAFLPTDAFEYVCAKLLHCISHVCCEPHEIYLTGLFLELTEVHAHWLRPRGLRLVSEPLLPAGQADWGAQRHT